MNEKAKIMIVDDDENNLKLFDAILSPMGYEIIMARDGAGALESVRKSPPDIILLDVMMPGIDGIEVCRRIKQDCVTQMIPVIIITSLDGKEYKIRGIEAGADDFLGKPVDKLELTIRIKNLLKIKEYHDHIESDNEILESEVTARTKDLKTALDKLGAANKTVKESYLDTIYRLSIAAENRDEETGAHIHRMSLFTVAIARKMGLPQDEVELLLYASPMHDVGKIGIPDRILLKPGKLDEDEWVIMKQHTTMGAKILAGSHSELLQKSESIAMSHHEKFDGSGYPRGLSQATIPLEGRITAIADVFDAVISKRPYKPAIPIDRALSIIKEGVGSHFDPEVAEAFIGAFDEILKIVKDIPNKGVQYVA